jgi:hypothetical protein
MNLNKDDDVVHDWSWWSSIVKKSNMSPPSPGSKNKPSKKLSMGYTALYPTREYSSVRTSNPAGGVVLLTHMLNILHYLILFTALPHLHSHKQS